MRESELSLLARAARAQPILDRDRELALMRRWRDEGDVAARDEVVKAHLKMAVSVARRYARYGSPAGEVAQEASEGLLKAANLFDPDMGFRFSTYAMQWIRAQVEDHVIRNGPVVRVGPGSVERKLFYNLRKTRAEVEARLGHGASPTEVAVEVARRLGLTLHEVQLGMQGSGRVSSLDAPMGDGEGDATRASRIPSDSPLPDELTDQVIVGERRKDWIRDAMARLDQRERTIVRFRQYCDPDEVQTFECLARRFGVSRERVRQIEAVAMRKLRDQLVGSPLAAALAPDLVDA